MTDYIQVTGAREHNLDNIDVSIPRDTYVVITGLSGSGKSSLAFDTIYAEGQRRYVESLSTYARQFLGVMEKPDVEQIEGLSPAISIDQKSTSKNPRSTVATVTEIYDYLRLLFARVGTPHCPVCGRPVHKLSKQKIVDTILDVPTDTRLVVLAPMFVDKKGEFAHVPDEFTRSGFSRARVDGVIYALDEWPDLEKNKKHTIEVVVDRLVNTDNTKKRLSESVEQALDLADGVVKILNVDTKEEYRFSQNFACDDHPDVSIPELAPRMFSFNSPHGACSTCTGLGVRLEVNPELVVPNERLSIAEGAIRPWSRVGRHERWYVRKVRPVVESYGDSLDTPWKDLSADTRQAVLYGAGEEKFTMSLGRGRFTTTYPGVIPNLERRYHETDSDFIRREIQKYMVEKQCQACGGKRLKPEALAVTVDGFSIMDISELAIDDAKEFFQDVRLPEQKQFIARQILKEINERLKFLLDVGLNYLTLARNANTLSGGEAQRIRLATQIGSGLTGVLYVLDEPTIGLHQRDNHRLINTLKNLRSLGNTVLVVEHDEETIRSADWVLDIGPGPGAHGGQVVAAGTPKEVAKTDTATGRFLSGQDQVNVAGERRSGNGQALAVRNAREHNLKSIDVSVPLGKFVAITGVSGSGKSTLMNNIIAKHLAYRLHRAHEIPGQHDDIQGVEHLDKAVNIDQSPIGRTPRSNPATYTGIFTYIRELFAKTPESKIRGYKPGRFSFNVKGGRCEACRGDGIIKIEMHFLPDVYIPCEECKGRRYNREALEVHYKGKNIADVLDMTVEQALEFFANIPALQRKLQTLNDVGLSYIRLGQPATTLSGGEAQRVKLASELSRRATGKTLYILDEPTTGLHFADVRKLLDVLNALVDTGNTVLIIEHNLDVIKSADHIIDLGPEGGDEGGYVVAEGTPEHVAAVPKSYTGQYLQRVLRAPVKT